MPTLQVEFVDALIVDSTRDAELCVALNATLQTTAQCGTLLPLPQDSIRLAAVRFDTGPVGVDIYAVGNNLSDALTDALRAAGFFTLNDSYVSLIANYEDERGLLIGLTIACLVVAVLCALYVLWAVWSTAKNQSALHMQKADPDDSGSQGFEEEDAARLGPSGAEGLLRMGRL